MGDRMTKSDAELMQTIMDGKGVMPSWKDKLPRPDLESALGYLRELALRTGYGTDIAAFNGVPEQYFIFNPPGIERPFERHWSTDTIDAP